MIEQKKAQGSSRSLEHKSDTEIEISLRSRQPEGTQDIFEDTCTLRNLS
jgi:hypothetical protein